MDCDDNDASVGSNANDMDCDGVTTAIDCDDNDASVGSNLNDADCDGVLSAAAGGDDCDDNDPNLGSQALDNDCDGFTFDIDCDDSVFGSANGCTDPNFCEYDPNAACDDGSCATAGIPGAPQIDCPASLAIANDLGVCGAEYNYSINVTNDCSTFTLSQTSGLTSGSIFPIGLTTNTFVAVNQFMSLIQNLPYLLVLKTKILLLLRYAIHLFLIIQPM